MATLSTNKVTLPLVEVEQQVFTSPNIRSVYWELSIDGEYVRRFGTKAELISYLTVMLEGVILDD
jgi:hypothetical protein